MANVPTPKIKITEPDTFDGSPARFCNWKWQILIFVCAWQIMEDDDWILLTLSHMKCGMANAWATWYFDQHTTDA
jgi:hypothetical protein